MALRPIAVCELLILEFSRSHKTTHRIGRPPLDSFLVPLQYYPVVITDSVVIRLTVTSGTVFLY